MAILRNKIKKKQNAIRSAKKSSFLMKFLLTPKLLFASVIIILISIIYLNFNLLLKPFYDYTARAGFVLSNLSIEGQKYSTHEQISKKLQLRKNTPIFAISLNNLKSRLEQLPWIKYVTVERILPDSIYIFIIERTPIALGQKDRKLYVIDDDGIIINEKDLAAHLHLPIIIGDGAEIYAHSLINSLKKNEELFKRINSIIRVSERRWNVRFDNELEVKLPEENMEKAWDKIIKLYKNNELFNDDIMSIDLRVANKLYVEKK